MQCYIYSISKRYFLAQIVFQIGEKTDPWVPEYVGGDTGREYRPEKIEEWGGKFAHQIIQERFGKNTKRVRIDHSWTSDTFEKLSDLLPYPWPQDLQSEVDELI